MKLEKSRPKSIHQLALPMAALFPAMLGAVEITSPAMTGAMEISSTREAHAAWNPSHALQGITPIVRATSNASQYVAVQGKDGATSPAVLSDALPSWGYFVANFHVDTLWELPAPPNGKSHALKSLSLWIPRTDPARRDWKGMILVSNDGKNYRPLLAQVHEEKDAGGGSINSYTRIRFSFAAGEVVDFRYICLWTHIRAGEDVAAGDTWRAPRIAEVEAEIETIARK